MKIYWNDTEILTSISSFITEIENIKRRNISPNGKITVLETFIPETYLYGVCSSLHEILPITCLTDLPFNNWRRHCNLISSHVWK